MSSSITGKGFTEGLGCHLVSYMMNSVLFGMALLLVGQYFTSKHSALDSRAIRVVVAILGVEAVAQYIFRSLQMYQDYSNLAQNISGLDIISVTASAQLTAIYVIAFTAQMFFASRVWMITKRSLLYTAPIVVLALLQIAAGLAQMIISFRIGHYSRIESTAKITSTQSGATAACDLTITVILCYTLWEARTGIRRTDSMINSMIVYALERGAITSLCAILNLTFFLAKPGTFFFTLFLEPSSQLYVISVLSMLANRKALRNRIGGRKDSGSGQTYPLASFPAVHISPDSPRPIEKRDNFDQKDRSGVEAGVFVQKQVLTWSDDIGHAS